ncbi:hypothetical protein ACFWDA_23500 [Rhodococcus zopfii]|uniref:hypothetical protein n=2 Tax=Rhodococcus zopfii TaxID=43772 RepID=UPI0036509AA4
MDSDVPEHGEPQPARHDPDPRTRTIWILGTAVVVLAGVLIVVLSLFLLRSRDADSEATSTPPAGGEATSAPTLPSTTDSAGEATRQSAPPPPTTSVPAEEDAPPERNRPEWPGPNFVGLTPSPEFPTSLPQWTMTRSWTVLPRYFDDSPWTEAPGPDYGAFPATMNGCDSSRFLVRWRAVNDTSRLVATYVDAVGTPGMQVTGNAGWMDLDQCHTPAFRLLGATDGSTLTDVTIAVQQYMPAP